MPSPLAEAIGHGAYRVRGIVLSRSSRTPVASTRVVVSASDLSGEDISGAGLYGEGPYGAGAYGDPSGVYATVPVYSDLFLRQRVDNVYSREDGTFEFFVPSGRYRFSYPAGTEFHQPADLLFLGEHMATLVRLNGTNVAMRRNLNFIEGPNVGLTVVDDPINDEVDITVETNIAEGAVVVTHASTTGQTANDHHAQAHSDADHTSPPDLKRSEIGWLRKTSLLAQSSTPAAGVFEEVASISALILYLDQVRASVTGSVITTVVGRLRFTQEDSAGAQTTVDIDSPNTNLIVRFVNGTPFRPDVGDISLAPSWTTTEVRAAYPSVLTTGRRLVKVALWVKRDVVTDPVAWAFQAIAHDLRS